MSETGSQEVPAPTQTTKADTAGPSRLGLVAWLKRLKGPIVAVAAVGAVLSGLVGYWNVYRTVQGTAAPEAASARSGEPAVMSIAVLPFTGAGVKAIDESVVVRLTQDVASALARSARYALVASYGSVSKYAGTTPDARAAGRELNVRYLVEGDIRPQGDKVSVGIRFIDAQTARELWNDRLETDTSQLHTDAIVGTLANRVLTVLFDAEMRRASQQRGTTADATVLWLRAIAADDESLKGMRERLRGIDESLRLDPNSVSAWASRTFAISRILQFDPQADRDRLIGEMEQSSLRAVAADRNDRRAWRARSETLALQYRWNEALEALSEVSRIDPNWGLVYTDRALLKIYAGQPEDAFAELDKSIRLDPSNAGEAMRLGCRAHLALGHYDEAIRLCERASVLNNVFWIDLYLTAAYAQSGQMDKASAAKAKLLKLQPGYTIARFRTYRPSDNAVYWQQTEAHILAGLRKAGIPEQ